MKKLLYLAAFVITCAITTSCTEEHIAPQTTESGNVTPIKF